MTRKKTLKALALVLALALTAGLLWMANALLGNPISYALANRGASAYLQAHYPDTDYRLEKAHYSFKDGSYYAAVWSPSSRDTQFTLCLDSFGSVVRDDFEQVENRSTTERRLQENYRALVDPVLESPSFLYAEELARSGIVFGKLEIRSRDNLPGAGDAPDALVQEDLILDGDYDLYELGRQAGTLVVYADSDTVTPEHAAEILLALRAFLDEKGISFRWVDFTLQPPRPEEGPRPDVSVGTLYFPYEDIYEEGMVDRVKASDAALRSWYASWDK